MTIHIRTFINDYTISYGDKEKLLLKEVADLEIEGRETRSQWLLAKITEKVNEDKRFKRDKLESNYVNSALSKPSPSVAVIKAAKSVHLFLLDKFFGSDKARELFGAVSDQVWEKKKKEHVENIKNFYDSLENNETISPLGSSNSNASEEMTTLLRRCHTILACDFDFTGERRWHTLVLQNFVNQVIERIDKPEDPPYLVVLVSKYPHPDSEEKTNSQRTLGESFYTKLMTCFKRTLGNDIPSAKLLNVVNDHVLVAAVAPTQVLRQELYINPKEPWCEGFCFPTDAQGELQVLPALVDLKRWREFFCDAFLCNGENLSLWDACIINQHLYKIRFQQCSEYSKWLEGATNAETRKSKLEKVVS